jgi:hypothetical protein
MPDSSALVYYVPAAGGVSGSRGGWRARRCAAPNGAATGGCDVSTMDAVWPSSLDGESTALVVAGSTAGGEVLRVSGILVRSPALLADDRLLAFRHDPVRHAHDVVEADEPAAPAPAGCAARCPTAPGSSTAARPAMALRPSEGRRRYRQLTFGDVSHLSPTSTGRGAC